MIRPFVDGDADDLVDVWYRASLEAHPFLSDAFLEKERTEILRRWLPLSETSVYVADGSLAGFISMVGNEVGGIFVDPDRQRRGIGSTLLDHVRDSRQFLELSVFEKNMSARHFYTSYGFEPIGTHFNEEAGERELRMRFNPSTEPGA